MKNFKLPNINLVKTLHKKNDMTENKMAHLLDKVEEIEILWLKHKGVRDIVVSEGLARLNI